MINTKMNPRMHRMQIQDIIEYVVNTVDTQPGGGIVI